MSRINTARVVAGGLLAGVVINIGETILNVPILGAQMDAAMRELGREPVDGMAIAGFIVGCFLVGIMAVSAYAAIRPRFGAGPGTALRAGVAVWVLAWAFPNYAMALMGLLPVDLIAFATLWGLVEIPLATVIGARVYREDEPAGDAAAAPAESVPAAM